MTSAITHIKDLTPDPANARAHTPRNVGLITDALQEVGAARSIVIDEAGVILAGNATVEAAAAAGIERVQVVDADGETIIAVRRAGLTAAQKTRLALYDNRAAELAGWDSDVLAALQAEDAALLAGLWRDDELAALLPVATVEPGGGGDEFDTTPAEGPTRCQVGDVWAIGAHRLAVGDCRDYGTLERLLDGTLVQGVFTSPPYAEQRKAQYGGTPADEYVAWWEDVQANARAVLRPDGSFFVNIKAHCADGERSLYVMDLVLAMRRQWGWRFVDEFAWVRAGVPGGWPNRFKNGWEPVYQFSTGLDIAFYPDAVSHDTEHAFDYSPANGKSKSGSGLLGKEHGTRFKAGLARPSNVLEVGTGGAKVSGEHPAEYPVGLPDFFIQAYSAMGDAWLDPFLGSGTTLIAAHRTGRICYGCELSPQYADVILRRAEAEGIGPIERLTAYQDRI